MSRKTYYMRGKVKPSPHMGLGGCLLALPTQRPTTHRALDGLERSRRWLNCGVSGEAREEGKVGGRAKEVKRVEIEPYLQQKSRPNARALVGCLCTGLCQAGPRKSEVMACRLEVNQTTHNRSHARCKGSIRAPLCWLKCRENPNLGVKVLAGHLCVQMLCCYNAWHKCMHQTINRVMIEIVPMRNCCFNLKRNVIFELLVVIC